MSIIQDIRNAFEKWQNPPQDVCARIDRALADKTPIYVFGRNENSEVMAKHLPMTAFVDDFIKEDGQNWMGFPIVRTHQVPSDAIIVSAVLHRRPHEGLAVLEALPQKPAVMQYADFERVHPERFAPIPTTAATRATFFSRMAEFEDLGARLADDESRKTLFDIMMYRLTSDPAYTTGYTLRDSSQYFDVPLGIREDAVFVDGGGFKGETSEIFFKHYPKYGGVHFFEPGAEALSAAKANMNDFPRITYHACGLGDAKAELYFDDTVGTSSCISDSGNVKISVEKLDDALQGQRADFIKYDLEGYEPKALAGAAQTIKTWHPALTICVYHHPNDFLDVPAQVLKSRGDYKIALRHYTQGWSETVMYFIPEKKAAA